MKTLVCIEPGQFAYRDADAPKVDSALKEMHDHMDSGS